MTAVPRIEIIEDLSWLGKVWENEVEPAVPYALEAKVGGQSAPALVVIGDDGILVHRGQTALVQQTTREIRAWLGFFMQRPIVPLREVRLETLRKWCDVSTDDGPCTHCNATGVVFGATMLERRWCPHCTLGRVRKPVWGRIGAELVNLRAILGPLAQLRGDVVHFGRFDDNAPAFWSDAWLLVVEPPDVTPDQVAATAFE